MELPLKLNEPLNINLTLQIVIDEANHSHLNSTFKVGSRVPCFFLCFRSSHLVNTNLR